MSVFTLARSAWHLVPASIRARPTVRRTTAWVARALERHDDRYDAEYYEYVERTTGESAPYIAASIARDLAPRTLLDLGCGTGAILDAVRAHGVTVRGLEYSEAALAHCRRRALDVRKFDLTKDRMPAPEIPFDVVLSTEVAEHIPEALADPLIDALTSQGPTVVFTAATPGQGGLDHVNEQPHAYWIAKFAARGFALDEPLTQAWRAEWQGRTASWYADNLMLFRRRAPAAEARA
jgi:SAM-dependent methyltransferase